MPRAATKPAYAAADNVPRAGLTRHRSPAELKLEALTKEHERLLREIGKRKAACESAEQAARDAANAFHQRIEPMRRAFMAALEELRAIFEALLAPKSRLNKRERARVRKLFVELMPEPFDDEEPSSRGPGRAPPSEPPPSEREFVGGRAREGDPSFSAPRPAEKNTGVLRAVFRRLAIALHPDKVRDPEEKERRTRVMKDITRAYESGDVARLLEIERTWLAQLPLGEDDGALARRIASLLGANTELRRQLRTLTAQLKALKAMLPRAPSKRRRSTSALFEVTAEERIAQDIERELAHVRRMRDHARKFADDEIDIETFLRGPESEAQLGDDDLVDLLAQLIVEAQAADVDFEPDARAAPSRRKSSRR